MRRRVSEIRERALYYHILTIDSGSEAVTSRGHYNTVDVYR